MALAVPVAWLPSLAAASDLSWAGPVECAEREQLLFQIERALVAPLAETGRFQLQVHVERVAPEARAILRIAGDTADVEVKQRLLVAPDCETLVDTLAVAIALAIEAAVPPSVANVVAPSEVAAQPLDSGISNGHWVGAAGVEPEPVRPVPVPRGSAWLVGDTGSLPGPALGVGLGFDLGWPRLQIGVLATLWLEQHAQLASSSAGAVGGDLRLLTAGIVGCTNPLSNPAGPLLLSLCVGWEMGRLSGRGTGITAPRDAQALWAAPSLQAGLSWRLPETRLSVGARVGVATPLGREEFVLDRLGTVHQPASLVGRAALGMNVALE